MKYFIIDNITNNYHILILDILSFIAIINAILVIISRNPVISILYLIVLFVNISLYLLLIGIHFLGLTYILVYVGAIAILFLFIIMLLNIKLSDKYYNKSNPIPLAFLISIMFFYPLYNILPNNIILLKIYGYNIFQQINNYIFNINININNNNNNIKDELYWIYQPNWDIKGLSKIDIESIGMIFYTSNAIYLIIISLILLLSMIGCIILTTNKEECQ